MKEKCSKTEVAVISALIAGVLVALGMSVWSGPDAKIEGWTDYKTAHGLVFGYPEGYGVTENADPERPDTMNYFIVGLEHDGTIQQHPPVLQVNTSPSSISLALWEGIPWEGYPDILKTMKWE